MREEFTPPSRRLLALKGRNEMKKELVQNVFASNHGFTKASPEVTSENVFSDRWQVSCSGATQRQVNRQASSAHVPHHFCHSR